MRSFQSRVAAWMRKCFTPEICRDIQERGDRFLEEALELLQSQGYDPSRVATLVRYVYGRPVGEPRQELGGVMVTLAAYADAIGIHMDDEGETELERISSRQVIVKIRQKQESKRGLHTPLPTAEAKLEDDQKLGVAEYGPCRSCGAPNSPRDAGSGGPYRCGSPDCVVF